MTLYEINAEILAAIAAAEEQAQANDGCIDDDLAERIDALEIDRATKIENIASYIINLRSDAEQLSAEAKRLADRSKHAETKAAGLERYLWAQQTPAGSYGLRKIGYRRSESVYVESVDAIPQEFLRTKTTTEPDKSAIKAWLKTGNEVPGARLVESQNIHIK